LFTQSSPVLEPLLQAFPFPSTLGEVTLHQLSQASMFIYSSHRKWVFPPLLWSFPPTAAFTSFPASGCWACAAAPAFSSLACLFTLFATCLFFFCYCLLFSFSFFPEWGLVCPRGYADLVQGYLWESHMPLSSPCGLHLPKPSGCWHLAVAWEPSWFLP
jgi:hypothetical protein